MIFFKKKNFKASSPNQIHIWLFSLTYHHIWKAVLFPGPNARCCRAELEKKLFLSTIYSYCIRWLRNIIMVCMFYSVAVLFQSFLCSSDQTVVLLLCETEKTSLSSLSTDLEKIVITYLVY